MSKTPHTDRIFATKHNQPPTHLMDEMRKMEMQIIDMKAQLELIKDGVPTAKKTKTKEVTND
jgi:hypothetical protein